MSELNSLQQFPQALSLDYKFFNVLPTIRINYKLAQRTNFFLLFRTSTNAPTVAQLQNVINNSNPQQLSVGNPSLKTAANQ